MSWNACLVRIQRKDKFESFLVTSDKFTIGRSPECDFVLADTQVSRKHLGVLIRSGQIFIKDLHSANGTKMGAAAVPVETVMAYKHGEAVRLGTADLVIYLEYVEKKIDLKNLAEGSTPEEIKKEYQHHLESSKARNKALFDEYENLVKNFKEYSKTETEKFQSENDRIIRESEERIKIASAANEEHILQLKQVAELEIKKRIESADTEAQEIISRSESKALSILESSEQKAKITLHEADERAKSSVLQAEASATEILASAEKKATQIISTGEQRLQELHSRLESEEKRILSETKNKNESLAQQLQDEASKKAEEINHAAILKSKALIHDAEIEADLLLKTARSKAAASQNESEVQSKNVMSEAALKAEKFIADANMRSSEIIERAEYKSKQLTTESEASAKKLLQEVQTRVDLQYEKFEDHKKLELARLKGDNESFKAQLESASNKELEKHKEAFELKVRLFDDECSIRRKNLERDLSGQLEQLQDLKFQESKIVESIAALTSDAKDKEKEQHRQLEALNHLLAKINTQNQTLDQQALELQNLASEKQAVQSALKELIRDREAETAKIQNLKQQLKQERQNLEIEQQAGRGRIDEELSRLKEKELKNIDRLRVDALAQIEAQKSKALDEIVQNKSMFMINLSERIQGLFVALHKKSTNDLDLPALKKEVFSMIQSAVEEQSFELTQKHEGDIRHLVKQETQKRRMNAKKSAIALIATAASAIGFYVYQGGNLENIMLGRNASGESAAEEFGRQQREQRDSKKFSPPQSDFIKSSYTDNVLYTRNYFTVFTSPQIQEQWITLLNGIFSKDFNLEDDAIVKFVAAESTLVTKLQQEKDQIVPDFAQIGIDKMRKVEKESTEQMKAILKDPAFVRKFQSVSEKFWHDKLQDRLPASK